VIKTSFPGLHAWKECNIDDVHFLRHQHRHIFHVTVKWTVTDDNRELEFFMCKAKVDKFIANRWPPFLRHTDVFIGAILGNMSCEMIAKEIMEGVNADFVSIFEDNENGAEVTRMR